jgi:cystathionine gamma-lyase
MGKYGFAFASGMAAISTVMSMFESGDHVVSTEDVYGGSYRVFQKVFKRFGMEFTSVDSSRPELVEAAIRPNTKMLWIETPTNPLLQITDIRRMASIASQRGILLAVDNTFMSPALQQPLALGADLVVHSTTKYIGGHSDVVGGFVGTSREDLRERLAFVQNSMGSVPGPFDSWLTLRGVKTLAIRMAAHDSNASEVARFLTQHKRIESVLYPGLPDHPGYAVHKNQASGGGGIISFRVRGDAEAACRMCSATKYFLLAESLGGVESLIEHPAIMTHASIPVEQRTARGISDNLIRISVGIESIEDLLEDLDQALSKM